MENGIQITTIESSLNTQSSRNTSVNTTVDVFVDKKKGTAASWGPDNKFPKELLDKISKSGIAKRGLRLQKQVHYGQGIFPVRTKIENGKRIVSPVVFTDPAITEAATTLKNMWYKRFLKGLISDFETFAISFPEYVVSDNYNRLLSAKRIPAAWCRFQVDEKTGRANGVLVSQNWDKKNVEDNEYVKPVALIDPDLSPEEVKEYCKSNKITKFIRPVFDVYNFEAHYPTADWHAVMNNDWLDVAASIPEYKKHMFANQVHTKFVIEFHPLYFEYVYDGEWHTYSVDKRIQIRKAATDAINESLSGNKNAAKSITSMKIRGSNGDYESAITITSVDDKLNDGVYLPEASAANSEISFALGVDPSIIGDGVPGGKLGAGSGSDKRVAFNILQLLKKNDREVTLEAIEFMHAYNEWPQDIEWKYENTTITTLDENPTSSQNTVDV